MKWFFYVEDDKTIQMRARAEGPGGMIGDAFHEMKPGDDDFYGVSYAAMLAAEGGVIEVSEDGHGELKKA